MIFKFLILVCLSWIQSIRCTVVKSEDNAQELSNVLFKYLDKNKDKIIDLEEWVETANIPRAYKFLNNDDSVIPFSDVDRNGNGFIEKDEFMVFISGLVALSADPNVPVLKDHGINFKKIEESSKVLFVKQYEDLCHAHVVNLDVQWERFIQCAEKAKFLDANKDNVIDQKEWNESQNLPVRYRYLRNTNLMIQFEKVDQNNDGFIDKSELDIFITGALVYVYNESIPVLQDDSINYEKIKETSLLLFEVTLRHKCKQNFTDIAVRFKEYSDCLRIRKSKKCLSEACLVDKPAKKENNNFDTLPSEDDLSSTKITKTVFALSFTFFIGACFAFLVLTDEYAVVFPVFLQFIAVLLAFIAVITAMMIRS